MRSSLRESMEEKASVGETPLGCSSPCLTFPGKTVWVPELKKPRSAHRVWFALEHGYSPPMLYNTCGTDLCIEPEHFTGNHPGRAQEGFRHVWEDELDAPWPSELDDLTTRDQELRQLGQAFLTPGPIEKNHMALREHDEIHSAMTHVKRVLPNPDIVHLMDELNRRGSSVKPKTLVDMLDLATVGSRSS